MKTKNGLGWSALLVLLVFLPSAATSQGNAGDMETASAAFKAGDFRTAHDLWQQQAYLGDPLAQFNLGYLYAMGKGVEIDYGVAFRWYAESAKQECRTAQCNLAGYYMTGRGVEVDHDKAISLYTRCVSAGGICRDQVDQVRSVVEGRLTWYAERDFPEAQYQLGSMAMDRGDFSSSTAWIQKAADLGLGKAQAALASSYLNGFGITPDYERGAQLLFRAMVEHRDDPAILRRTKYTAATSYHAGRIDAKTPAINTYVWAHLGYEDESDKGSVQGIMYDMMMTDAKNAMSDGELGTAFWLASEWSELFAAGLPGVTEEHLRTLDVPQ